jgi:hypothetical protein
MAGIINTEKVLNNTWNVGEDLQVLSGTIKINSDMYKQYDFAMTDDPILLQDKKSTQELLYKIFKESSYFEKYGGFLPDSSIPFAKKVEKGDIVEIFYYMKEHILKEKKLSIIELVIEICEFFDFNYDYVVNTVLSIPLKSKLYEEVYESGMKEKMTHEEKLF